MAVNKVVYGNETLLDLTGDSVTASTLALGESAHDASGKSITGTYTGVKALTEAEYNSLGPIGRYNGTLYIITDAGKQRFICNGIEYANKDFISLTGTAFDKHGIGSPVQIKKVYGRCGTYQNNTISAGVLSPIQIKRSVTEGSSIVTSTISLPSGLILSRIDDDVQDVLDVYAKTVHRKCKRVDLGSLNWSYRTSGAMTPYFYVTLPDAKCPDDTATEAAKFLCAKYAAVPRVSTSFVDKTMTCGKTSGLAQLQIKDTTYTSAAAFKTSLNGKYLVYEALTYTEEHVELPDEIFSLGGSAASAEDGVVSIYVGTAIPLVSLKADYVAGYSNAMAGVLDLENRYALYNNGKAISRCILASAAATGSRVDVRSFGRMRTVSFSLVTSADIAAGVAADLAYNLPLTFDDTDTFLCTTLGVPLILTWGVLQVPSYNPVAIPAGTRLNGSITLIGKQEETL